MIERIIIIEDVDPQVFYGVNNSNINLIRNLFPKLRLMARGNIIKAIGDSQETEIFEKKIKEIEAHATKFNRLDEETIIDIVKGQPPKEVNTPGVIIYGQSGRPITPRNANQVKMVRSFAENDLTFALGPAGTGKTYIAIALAVASLKNRECKRLILSRPAVEAGEKLGFLPGDMKDKIDPYLRPLYDALEDMLPPLKLKEYMESDVIQIAPLAFMRGRTLNDAVIILDEAQNTTKHQMKMFLTRLGVNSRMIVTGDATQVDLPRTTQSGLLQALKILRNVKGIGIIEYGKKDIVRHPLVQRIVDAYEAREKDVDAEFDAKLAQIQNSDNPNSRTH